jgi:enoyl-CoA hydratase
MSLDMSEGLGHALIELRDAPDVRVVILVGAGDKAFVSGADITSSACSGDRQGAWVAA